MRECRELHGLLDLFQYTAGRKERRQGRDSLFALAKNVTLLMGLGGQWPAAVKCVLFPLRANGELLMQLTAECRSARHDK